MYFAAIKIWKPFSVKSEKRKWIWLAERNDNKFVSLWSKLILAMRLACQLTQLFASNYLEINKNIIPFSEIDFCINEVRSNGGKRIKTKIIEQYSVNQEELEVFVLCRL